MERHLPVVGSPPTAPDADLGMTADELEAEIRRLKRERNAVILAHYYQEDELQDLADHVGDSLQLSQAAAKTPADGIAFCGVHFMAETAKILNPNKIVVVADLDAGCSVLDSSARSSPRRPSAPTWSAGKAPASSTRPSASAASSSSWPSTPTRSSSRT